MLNHSSAEVARRGSGIQSGWVQWVLIGAVAVNAAVTAVIVGAGVLLFRWSRQPKTSGITSTVRNFLFDHLAAGIIQRTFSREITVGGSMKGGPE